MIKSSNQVEVARAVATYVEWLWAERPEVNRVIWFGSRVKGTPTPGSDVDLWIVISRSEKPRRDRLPDYLPVGFPEGIELFVYTQAEFAVLQETSPSWSQVIISGREL